METRYPILEVHGPIAEHDQACAIFSSSEPAVFNLNRGVFEPSWIAQRDGWQLVCARTWLEKLALMYLMRNTAGGGR